MTANIYAHTATTVLITRTGSGIGKAIAHAFLESGANAVVAGRTPAPLEETIAGFGSDRARAVADVAQRGSAIALVDAAVESFGRLGVIVSNAGRHESSEIVELPKQPGVHCLP